MKKLPCACLGLCLALSAGAQPAVESSAAAGAGSPGGIPVTDLIAAVARSSGKKLFVHPRVRASVALLGRSPASVSYSDLVTILRLHGFAAVEGTGAVLVVPDAMVRSMEAPLLSEKETRPESEVVTDVYRVKSSSAALLVPILRPILPQYAHLAADLCSNMLIIVDTYANVRRVEAIVQRLDVGEPYKPQSCDPRAGGSPPRSAPAK
jgi:type II secretory pathway component GspD/PulD (secretin)